MRRRTTLPTAALHGAERGGQAEARHEIANLDDRKDRVGLLEEMIVGQVVFATVLTTLRRLAEEHHSHGRFGEDRRD